MGISVSDIETEVEAIRHAHSSQGKGSWGEVFNKENRVSKDTLSSINPNLVFVISNVKQTRTLVAILAMFGQVRNLDVHETPRNHRGTADNNSKSLDKPLAVNIASYFISNRASRVKRFCLECQETWLVLCVWSQPGLLLMKLADGKLQAPLHCEKVTNMLRRPILLIGGSLMASFLYIVGGIATVAHPSEAERKTMVHPVPVKIYTIFPLTVIRLHPSYCSVLLIRYRGPQCE